MTSSAEAMKGPLSAEPAAYRTNASVSEENSKSASGSL